MSAFDAVVFDFDGTIIDTESAVYESARLEMERVGLELPVQHWREVVGTAAGVDWIKEIAAVKGPDFDRQEVLDRRRETVTSMLDGVPLRPGVDQIIRGAQQRGLALAVASSSPRRWVDSHLDRLDLARHFKIVTTRDDVETAKPAPDLYLLASSRLGIEPACCVALEDSSNGAVAAKAAGMSAIVAPNPVTIGGDFAAADLVVESLDQPAVAEFLKWDAHTHK